MSLLICTPMYGGQCTMPYFTSCLALQESFQQVGLDYNWLTTGNESLIQRARNTSAMTFLGMDYQKLMFIDADIEFAPEDVAKLWNMDTDIAVAAYSMKRPDMPLSAWVNGEMLKIEKDTPNPLEVDYAGTGFMMIDRGVFEKLKGHEKIEEHIEGQSLEPCWNFFDCAVEDDKGKNIYLSEDYWFCKRSREMGYKVLMDTSIRLGHWGTSRFG